jgi:hypothetical protein
MNKRSAELVLQIELRRRFTESDKAVGELRVIHDIRKVVN